MLLPTPFPLWRYRLQAVVEVPVQLPEYAGSMLRGAFGHALRARACRCGRGHVHASDCVYAEVFEAPAPPWADAGHAAPPKPYVVEPPARGVRQLRPGQRFGFGMVLIGAARRHLPLLAAAWDEALQAGFGGGRARLDEVALEHGDAAGEHGLRLPAAGLVPDQVTLELATPLRLRRRGTVLNAAALDAHDLVLALVHRIAGVARFHLQQDWQPDFPALLDQVARLGEDRALAWHDWGRYSQRQQRAMRLGGVVGSWRLRGELDLIWPLLQLGQWLHVGKNTTFGLGGYRLRNDA